MMHSKLLDFPKKCFAFYRMSITSFNELFKFIGPAIAKEDTNFKHSIPVQERCALRYGTSGVVGMAATDVTDGSHITLLRGSFVMKLNGEKTLEEDLADIAGLRLAHDANKNRLRTKPDSRRMPGLEKYSTEQMFWISAASVDCTIIRAEWIPDLIRYGTHSLAPFRVIGAISNMPEFAKDFNCKENSLMNPAKPCAVW